MGILEQRGLCWRGRAWPSACERISSSRFLCYGLGGFDSDLRPQDFDSNAPSDLTVDGVPCRSFSINVDKHDGVELEVELTAPLALIEFKPHQEFTPRTGDTSYQDALASASATHAINAAEIRETAKYWVFPVFGIGCCGVLVDKQSGHVTEFGSYTGIDDWIWGYEQGLLDEPPRDFVVLSVRDAEVTLRTLKHFVVRPSINALPATFRSCAVWQAIKPLREAGDAFAWRCESHQV